MPVNLVSGQASLLGMHFNSMKSNFVKALLSKGLILFLDINSVPVKLVSPQAPMVV